MIWFSKLHYFFRWPLVEQALLDPGILQSTDLIEAILSYNRSDRWNFDGLKIFLDECIEDLEKSKFYSQILPKVIRDNYIFIQFEILILQLLFKMLRYKSRLE